MRKIVENQQNNLERKENMEKVKKQAKIYTITDKHPKNRNPAAKPIPVNSFLKKPISHTSSGYSFA